MCSEKGLRGTDGTQYMRPKDFKERTDKLISLLDVETKRKIIEWQKENLVSFQTIMPDVIERVIDIKLDDENLLREYLGYFLGNVDRLIILGNYPVQYMGIVARELNKNPFIMAPLHLRKEYFNGNYED